MDQFSFFADQPVLPPGFRYQADLISREHEKRLVEAIEPLPFKEFEFHGYVGKRRTVSFGWRYEFGSERLLRGNDMPDFLLELRSVAATFAGMPAERLQHVLVTEYSEGAAIGWHRDKAVFGEIVGISLLSPCTFRLRRKDGDAWRRVNITAEPRSAYIMSGESRTEWEHSIPGVPSLRYSITFRNLRES